MQKGDCILEWILAYKVKKKIKDIEMVSDLIMKEKLKKKNEELSIVRNRPNRNCSFS